VNENRSCTTSSRHVHVVREGDVAAHRSAAGQLVDERDLLIVVPLETPHLEAELFNFLLFDHSRGLDVTRNDVLGLLVIRRDVPSHLRRDADQIDAARGQPGKVCLPLEEHSLQALCLEQRTDPPHLLLNLLVSRHRDLPSTY